MDALWNTFISFSLFPSVRKWNAQNAITGHEMPREGEGTGAKLAWFAFRIVSFQAERETTRGSRNCGIWRTIVSLIIMTRERQRLPSDSMLICCARTSTWGKRVCSSGRLTRMRTAAGQRESDRDSALLLDLHFRLRRTKLSVWHLHNEPVAHHLINLTILLRPFPSAEQRPVWLVVTRTFFIHSSLRNAVNYFILAVRPFGVGHIFPSETSSAAATYHDWTAKATATYCYIKFSPQRVDRPNIRTSSYRLSSTQNLFLFSLFWSRKNTTETRCLQTHSSWSNGTEINDYLRGK